MGVERKMSTDDLFDLSVQPNPPALAQSWARGRLWRIYPRLAAKSSMAGPTSQGQAAVSGGATHP